jgi:hypothetical protein
MIIKYNTLMMNSNLHKEYLTYLFCLEVLMMALNCHETLSNIDVFLNLMNLIGNVYLQIFSLITFLLFSEITYKLSIFFKNCYYNSISITKKVYKFSI